MTFLKTNLNSIFNLTDIGKPNKIVGIEIMCKANSSIFISQKHYIESILKEKECLMPHLSRLLSTSKLYLNQILKAKKVTEATHLHV